MTDPAAAVAALAAHLDHAHTAGATVVPISTVWRLLNGSAAHQHTPDAAASDRVQVHLADSAAGPKVFISWAGHGGAPWTTVLHGGRYGSDRIGYSPVLPPGAVPLHPTPSQVAQSAP